MIWRMVPCETDSGFRGHALKRVAFGRPQATRFRLLFVHVVIAKPLRTFARHALDNRITPE
ncbi:MAG: hypothetical protein E5X60_37670 [Mesorhizobium sp.]|nr:MAG: hypothetical protein E5X60_37670 [Mesorhizobium sp.]